jgi:hypothetical protein
MLKRFNIGLDRNLCFVVFFVYMLSCRSLLDYNLHSAGNKMQNICRWDTK